MIAKSSIGLYIDLPQGPSDRPYYIIDIANKLYHNLAIDRLCVQVQNSKNKWVWSADALANLKRETQQTIELLIWPGAALHSTRMSNGSFDKVLSKYRNTLDAYRSVTNKLVIEAEGRPWGTLTDEMLQLLIGVFRTDGWEMSVTTHTGRVYSSNVLKAVEYANPTSFRVQAYSTAGKHGREWGEPFGPGRMQEYAYKASERVIENAKKANHGIETVVGMDLPLWGQDYDEGVIEALRLELSTALQHDVKYITYWSSKWIFKEKYYEALIEVQRSINAASH